MITPCLTDSFLADLAQGVQDLATDTLKIALYTGSATLGPGTTGYTSANEAASAGYTAGGLTLTGVTLNSAPGVAYLDFNDPAWVGTSFAVRGALIYNASKSDKSIAVLDFGVDQVTVGQNFLLQLPPPNPQTALIRIQF